MLDSMYKHLSAKNAAMDLLHGMVQDVSVRTVAENNNKSASRILLSTHNSEYRRNALVVYLPAINRTITSLWCCSEQWKTPTQ